MAASVNFGDALARALVEADELGAGGKECLTLLAGAGDWRAGVLWLVADEDELLRPAATFAADERAAEFVDRTRRLALGRGDGVPGRVWQEGVPVWHDDLRARPHWVRRAIAETAGLRAAALAPVATRQGRTFGVLELLGDGPRAAEPNELASVATAARQLAHFVLRIRAEEGWRSAEELRGSIVAAALDCIITADHDGRILDFNPAAEATFGVAREKALGRRLSEIIIPPHLRPAHERALHSYRDGRPSNVLNQRLELEGLRADGTTFPVELTVTRLGTVQPPVFAGFIRDLTDRRRAEAEVARLFALEHDARVRAEAAERTTRRIADALQRSLLPPHLPAIEGVELAASYRAGSDQADVGGDFYDVFALTADRWGIVIGDVCGKGPEAAAITALARYTVRTAAVREGSPAAVLGVLNDALLRDTGSEAFCTAVYATLDVGGAHPQLRFAVAGHPPPLVLGASGDVTAPGGTGTLLGVMPAPRLEEQSHELAPGEVLLLYTDGLIESRNASGRFGVDALRDLLAGLSGLDAASLVARIENALVSGGHRADDDLAILAVRAAAASDPGVTPLSTQRESVGASDLVALSLPAEPASVPEVRRAVVRLAQRAFAAPCCHRVATAVTEAAANVVVHAYREAVPGAIDVTARLEGHELIVVVEDNGCGVRARNDSPGLGLGLPLIRRCADELEIDERPDGGGASVRMRFRPKRTRAV